MSLCPFQQIYTSHLLTPRCTFELASAMGAELHLGDDHPVALELKSLRSALATFQVRLELTSTTYIKSSQLIRVLRVLA